MSDVAPDAPDGLGLTARFVDAAELASIMGIGEDDVLDFALDERIPHDDGLDGEPRFRILEHHEDDGPTQSGIVIYSTGGDPELDAEIARRRRARELSGLDAGDVDVDALAAALAERLRAAVFRDARVTVEDQRIVFHDPRGGGGASDVAFSAGVGEDRSAAERVLGAARHALETAQNELSEITSDPWPRRGPGALPDPHVELDGDRVRLFYGNPRDPVLELEPLRIADVLLAQ